MRFLYFFLLALNLGTGSALAQNSSQPELSPPVQPADTTRPQPLSQVGVPTRPGMLLLRKAAMPRVVVPLSLIGLGLISRNENVFDEAKEGFQKQSQSVFRGFRTSLDDYSRKGPIVAAYALQVAGVKGERGVVPFSIIWGLSHALNSGIVCNLKNVVAEARPDNPTDLSSFPSAHTADAFMTATLLHEQYYKTNPWISVGGYSMAAATGAMRIMNNRHWVTDVLAGASIGFLSAEAVWHLYPAAARLLPTKLGQKLLLVPTYAPGGTMGFTMVVR
ncbi:phosphatase PAP2 family protein [Hymenobacter sp. BT175]|uniref:phosphatase PAP2 family protein n=1 Tax=Hymenobacter translucens TaxID=2886507 RepID=UPI001D0E24E2|nr:phosphatase PAP2 family protein [Hymenobacter translucens]MCC2546862.1 phosphatase PAP2 family protein [Hymenobacter translucens]